MIIMIPKGRPSPQSAVHQATPIAALQYFHHSVKDRGRLTALCGRSWKVQQTTLTGFLSAGLRRKRLAALLSMESVLESTRQLDQ